MSSKQLFRVYLTEKITAAVEEMFDAFESAVAAEHQEELSRCQQENSRLRSLLDVVIKPHIKLHKLDFHHHTLDVPDQDVDGQLHSELGPIQEDPEPLVIKQEPDLLVNPNQLPLGGTASHGPQANTKDSWCMQPSYLDYTLCEEDTEREVLPPNTTSGQIKAEPDGDYRTQPTWDLKRIAAGDPYGFTTPSENSVSAKGLDSGRHKPLQFQRTQRATRLSSRMSAEGGTPVETSNLKSAVKTEEPIYNCRVCGGNLNSLDSLISHVSIHSKNEECMCGVCGKRFEFPQRLGDHLKTHMRKNPICFVCGRFFTCMYDLEVHMKSHTKDQTKVPVLHIRSHKGQRAVRCLACRHGFSSVYALRKHQKTHPKEKRHCCQHCGKLFHQGGHLTEHLRIHTGEKPYSCHVCGQGFTRSFSVKIHLGVKHNIVEEVVPSIRGGSTYCCHVCGKGFRYHGCMKTHVMKTHMINGITALPVVKSFQNDMR